MKKILVSIVLYSLIFGVNAQSQNTSTIKVTGTKFPFAIMRQWIDAYRKTHPDVEFELSKSIPLDSADIMIAAHAFRPGELEDKLWLLWQ